MYKEKDKLDIKSGDFLDKLGFEKTVKMHIFLPQAVNEQKEEFGWFPKYLKMSVFLHVRLKLFIKWHKGGKIYGMV